MDKVDQSIRRCFWWALCWLLPLSGSAQVRASASFDPERVEAGDTFSLRVLISGVRVAPKRVSFAAWHDHFPAENIRSRSEWSRSGAQWVQQFTLIAFDSATLELPPLSVQLHLDDTVQTNSLQLNVRAPSAAAELRDMETIRDIRREPTYWYDYWPWGLAVLLPALLAVWYFRRRQKRPLPAIAAPVAPGPADLPPHELALQKLAALEQQQLWQNDQTGAYYAGLSLIVREYLENRFGIRALESTTREIVALLPQTDFPDNQKAVLDHLLQQADLVKYAEIPPPKTYHEQAMEKAKGLIRHSA